jgi:hypothetical protein
LGSSLDSAFSVQGVNSSHALKWSLLLLLLAVTLGWKLTVRSGGSGEPEENGQRKVAEFLMRHSFTVALYQQAAEGQPAIRASAADCRMLVAQSSPIAWEGDQIRRYAIASDQMFVVFGGKIYADQPVWLTVPASLWSRFKRELGLRAEAISLLTIIASESCDAERLPWAELG